MGWVPFAIHKQTKHFLAKANTTIIFGTLVHRQPETVEWPPRVSPLLEEVARCSSVCASDKGLAATLAVCGELKVSKPCVCGFSENNLSAPTTSILAAYIGTLLSVLLSHLSSSKHGQDDASHPRSSLSQHLPDHKVCHHKL